MRMFILLPALIVAGCGGNPATDGNANQPAAGAGSEPRYIVRAGPVPNARIDALAGTFQLLETGGPDAIPSNRTGGACLIFPAADLGFSQMAGRTCDRNSDCAVPTENPVGYCDVQTRACWSRPNRPGARAALCNAGITLTPSDLTAVPVQPVNAAQYGVAPGAKVRVLACLNKAGAIVGQNGCGSPNGPERLEVMGPIATIR